MCVECLCGEKSSTGSVRQLFLQQLRQWWGGRKDSSRVVNQRHGHHWNHHNWGWKGDNSAHRGRQKWKGSLQQVDTVTHKWRAAALSLLVQCIPLLLVYVMCFYRAFLPPKSFSRTILHPPSVFFFFWYYPRPVCSLYPRLPLTPEYSDQQSDGMLCSRSLCSGVSLKMYEGFKSPA